MQANNLNAAVADPIRSDRFQQSRGRKRQPSQRLHNNTIDLLNSSAQAGNLRWGVVPPCVWPAIQDFVYSIHHLAAQIAFFSSLKCIPSTSMSKQHVLSAIGLNILHSKVILNDMLFLYAHFSLSPAFLFSKIRKLPLVAPSPIR